MKTENGVVRDSLIHIPMKYDVDVAKEKVVGDLKNVIADFEDLLNAPTAMTGEKAPYVRARIQENLDRIRLQLAAAEVAAIVKAKATTRVTDEYVRQDT
jgi:ElaB/YqjD/DUF883 family membrane-anchored ribosome-binding protein